MCQIENIQEKNPVVFIKAIENEYFEKFMEGEIYMNTFSFFRKQENGDKTEGMLSYFTNSVAEIKTDSKTINAPFKNISLNQSFGNILCLYSVYNEKDEISENYLKVFEKRKMCVISPRPFLSRLVDKLNEKGYNILCGKVEYFNEDESQFSFLPPFRKQNKYSYENEYRILAYNTEDKPIEISIGSIKDIAFEVDFNSFPDNSSLNINFETKQINFY